MIVDVSFQGEYKIGDGPWLPIVEGEHIPSTKGDVTLRGLFQMFSPGDGAFLGYVPVGQTVSLYFNHIGGYTLTSQGERIPFDSENPAFGEDSCVICWGFLTITEEGPITIVLSNPHSYGNETAVDDFLERLFYSPADFRDQYALQEGAVSRNLGQSDLIPFEKELSFVKTYLDIEKVRFDDELEINLNIEATNFKLPVLTIQPIVENTVKHGTSKKEGFARLFLSTRETPDQYVITISDTGVGFDPDSYQMDGHKHVGISSVRQRLENLCNGSLTIESAVGIGTRATIRIPKKEKLTP